MYAMVYFVEYHNPHHFISYVMPSNNHIKWYHVISYIVMLWPYYHRCWKNLPQSKIEIITFWNQTKCTPFGISASNVYKSINHCNKYCKRMLGDIISVATLNGWCTERPRLKGRLWYVPYFYVNWHLFAMPGFIYVTIIHSQKSCFKCHVLAQRT